MDTKTKKNCEELIDERLAEREKDIALLEEGEEIAIGFHTETIHTITLSWGGPADFIEVRCVEDEVISMAYVYQDWFDGARRELDTGSAMWKYACQALGVN